jgi:hypothetical protein
VPLQPAEQFRMNGRRMRRHLAAIIGAALRKSTGLEPVRQRFRHGPRLDINQSPVTVSET